MSVCLQDCTYNGGQGNCRSGYVCEKELISSNPSLATCLAACVTSADCPNVGGSNLTCFNGFCCGAQGYHCCSGGTCPRGGTCGGGGVTDYCG